MVSPDFKAKSRLQLSQPPSGPVGSEPNDVSAGQSSSIISEEVDGSSGEKKNTELERLDPTVFKTSCPFHQDADEPKSLHSKLSQLWPKKAPTNPGPYERPLCELPIFLRLHCQLDTEDIQQLFAVAQCPVGAPRVTELKINFRHLSIPFNEQLFLGTQHAENSLKLRELPFENLINCKKVQLVSNWTHYPRGRMDLSLREKRDPVFNSMAVPLFTRAIEVSTWFIFGHPQDIESVYVDKFLVNDFQFTLYFHTPRHNMPRQPPVANDEGEMRTINRDCRLQTDTIKLRLELTSSICPEWLENLLRCSRELKTLHLRLIRSSQTQAVFERLFPPRQLAPARGWSLAPLTTCGFEAFTCQPASLMRSLTSSQTTLQHLNLTAVQLDCGEAGVRGNDGGGDGGERSGLGWAAVLDWLARDFKALVQFRIAHLTEKWDGSSCKLAIFPGASDGTRIAGTEEGKLHVMKGRDGISSVTYHGPAMDKVLQFLATKMKLVDMR